MKRFFSRLPKAALPTLVLLAAIDSAADSPLPDCALAQQVIAGTALVPAVELPADHEAFVESKAYDEPFTVQQYLSNPHPQRAGLMRTLSCKMRTAERINAAHGTDAALAPVAAGDQSCAAVTQALLKRALGRVPSTEQLLKAEQFNIVDEQSTFMGPMWLDPWPFHAVTRVSGDRLALHSRALYVPRAWWIPLPERFQGNYYCHLAAPSYLESIIRGESLVQS